MIEYKPRNSGKIEKIQLYLRSDQPGDFLSVGFGLFDIEENFFKIDIPTRDTFIPIEIDLSSLDIREIARFGFIINRNLSKRVILQIDKIDFNVFGSQTYRLAYKKATYTLPPSKKMVKAEFGAVQKRLEEYVESLLTTASELRFTQEVG